MRAVLLLLFALLSGGAAPLAAQTRPFVALQLPPRGSVASEGPTVITSGVLNDRALGDMLRHGFPARLHYRVELWSAGGWFDDLERTVEWDVIVRFDPLEKSYRVARISEPDRVAPLGEFAQLTDVAALLERPYQAPITPRRRGRRHYYNAVLQVETISYNDLDEVERWLRGELRPAVRGQKNPGTALGRGIRTLVVRLLGGERKDYVARSPTFRS